MKQAIFSGRLFQLDDGSQIFTMEKCLEITKDPFYIRGLEFQVINLYYITLEVNHHFENGGSFWMMINP